MKKDFYSWRNFRISKTEQERRDERSLKDCNSLMGVRPIRMKRYSRITNNKYGR